MSIRIIYGDCRKELISLPDQCVHCCMTSPPYFGLRDYGTAKWEGGDPECDHVKVMDHIAAVATSTLGGGKKSTGHIQEGFKTQCGRCGARRIDSQIGLESTPDAFVAEMVNVFREVRRVLRDDGTVWLNLGDSYSSGGRTTQVLDTAKGPTKRDIGTDETNGKQEYLNGTAMRPPVITGLGPKQLIGIPWRVAFALQVDGWYLRQDIIWSKPNPMPESVTDRCTKAHEYIFLLSKNARYYYDADAIKYESARVGEICGTGPKSLSRGQARGANVSATGNAKDGGFCISPKMSNKRSVWEIATQSFSDAHFATFPPALIEPCVLAGCPKGGTVLDPFAGAGTTGLVADRLQRNAVLIELNPDYVKMAQQRIHDDAPLLVTL